MERQIRSSSDKEIGGDFSLTPSSLESTSTNNYLQDKEDLCFLSTCRSAITEILKRTLPANNKLAFVPSFTCHVCVEPFVKEGYEVCPYSVETNLCVNWAKLVDDAARLNPSVILIHSYFGLNTLNGNRDAIDFLRERKVIIIEDLTHDMFSSFKRLKADYFIGSIRKWFPVPDGAFVKGLEIEEKNYREDKELVEKKMSAMLMKGSFFEKATNENSGYRQAGVDAEHFLDTRVNTYRMSDISKKICNVFDIEATKKQRKDNYNCLYDNLISGKGVRPVLNRCKENESPYMFPVYVEDGRSDFQKFMVSHKIFPTIIWGCPEDLSSKIDDNAGYIYNHIICFHCDHRYTTDDMMRVGLLINEYNNK